MVARGRKRTFGYAAVGLLWLSWMAGCVKSEALESSAGAGERGEDAFPLDGLVVDSEIVPVVGALVTLTPGNVSVETPESGRVQFGPLGPGDYTLAATKAGYAPVTVNVTIAQSQPPRIILTLIPIASNVPFHETHIFVAYIFCTMQVAGAFSPCLPLNVLTGQNITQDRAEFHFTIPREGLADLLHEMVWKAQATGRNMQVTIRPPNLALVVGGVTTIYLSKQGSSPLRSWVVPGKLNEGATAKFDGNVSMKYTTILRASQTNSTTGYAAVYIDHRVNNYFTFFYNRAGPREFTVIPDT